MRTEVIKADTIDVAVDRILVELGKDTTSSRENAIYFDGWDGLGASAVLQAIAKRLGVSNESSTRPAGLEFEEIIHIDCSKWESRRAMQREIAKQLNLPNWVMEMFDKQDEEDDFNGLDQGSRTEIARVVKDIYLITQNRRFLVILHNGSSEEIDIFDFGLSLDRYSNSKMLWTFQGRFRIDPKMIDSVKKSRITDVILSASSDGQDPCELWLYLVREEVAQVPFNKHGDCIIDPGIAADCVLYAFILSWFGLRINDYDWANHGSNYWVCDGIIALTDIDEAWQVGNVLHHEVPLLHINTRLNNDESALMASYHPARSAELMPYWITTTTSTFGFVVSPCGVIPNNTFQHSHRLGVLKLSRCAFSFTSPPFLCCQGLRFLWLDHCKDLPTSSTTDHHHTEAGKEAELDINTTSLWKCLESLWVLDLRYTDLDQILSAQVMDLMTQLRELHVLGAKNWDMSHLQGRLHNVRKLRVTKSTCYFNNNVFSEMGSMELLEFSGNYITQHMKSLYVSASNNRLKAVTVDGCNGLKIISFGGCKELKNIFIKGFLWSLEELDLSGTRVKTLNLTGVEAISLPKKIILLGCEKLRAILWPLSMTKKGLPKVLHIDTTSPSASAYGGEAPLVHPHSDLSLHQQKEKRFKGGWRIFLTDARLLRSLSPIQSCLTDPTIHIDICPAVVVRGSNIQGTSSNKHLLLMHSKYRDAFRDDVVPVVMMWDYPKIPDRLTSQYTCFIKMIMHGRGNRLLEDAAGDLLLPKFICDLVTSLHVFDNLSITSIPGPPQGSGWNKLRCCCVERCPRLHTVFTVPHDTSVDSFWNLETLWASKLLSALYIWDRPVEKTIFYNLNLLHLDHCPRLVHVLPFSMWEMNTFIWLETIELVYCGDLRELFPLTPELQEQDKILDFQWLEKIRLHELPRLQRICGHKMSTPRLKTIKIRGCWSLTRLPALGRDTKPPKVDCEKEWWDNLEWDGLEKYHHPSLYEPSHSLYYKAQLPRGTVLR